MANPRKKSNRKKTPVRAKVCRFSEQKVTYIDFTEADVLKKFMTEGGRILPRRITGVGKRYQAMLASAIKRARNIALVK
ncbi:30S ribosomal protein S18 [Lentisphaera profundi]|uniref:30S ribosomal protein S18 n=1 Tax=Lentisphaera profundi TaxID=1658616 RepID=A0ABY7VVD1_9BACT|nr:30S ribosomal protein S18 [Lentisphaera profundi]WDE98027.1 30S ribosomal protein S18 [Lentisphaera profundi]